MEENKIPKYPSKLKEEFLEAYHNPNIFKALNSIMVVVGTEIEPFQPSSHTEWLKETCTRLLASISDPNHELPGMLYGMISNAFDFALVDYANTISSKYPDVMKQSVNARDIYQYLLSTCSSIFMDHEAALTIVQVKDVMSIFADLVIETKRSDLLNKISPEFVADLVRESVDGIPEQSRKNLLWVIREHMKEYINAQSES